MRYLKRPTIRRHNLLAVGTSVRIPKAAAAFSLRVTDTAGVGVAFAAGLEAGAPAWHFAAGEGWSERELCLDDALDLWIVPDAANRRAELIIWE